jgi:hypothetical protein
MSSRNAPVGNAGRQVRLITYPPSMSPLWAKCGSLDVSQTYGSPQPLTGIALRVLVFLISKEYCLLGGDIDQSIITLLLRWRHCTVARGAVAMQRPQDERIYQTRFGQRFDKRFPRATSRSTTMETGVSTWSLPRCYELSTRLQLS